MTMDWITLNAVQFLFDEHFRRNIQSLSFFDFPPFTSQIKKIVDVILKNLNTVQKDHSRPSFVVRPSYFSYKIFWVIVMSSFFFFFICLSVCLFVRFRISFYFVFLLYSTRFVATEIPCPVSFNLLDEMSFDSMNLAKSSEKQNYLMKLALVLYKKLLWVITDLVIIWLRWSEWPSPK